MIGSNVKGTSAMLRSCVVSCNWPLLAGLILVPASVGCTSDRVLAEQHTDAGSEAGPPPTELVSSDAGSGDAVAPRPECTGDEHLVYVLSNSPAGIHRFNPQTLTFTRLSYLDCPDPTGTWSMAIDRFNVAWIQYKSGRFFQVGLDDFKCTEIRVHGLPDGLQPAGMGFSKNDSGTGESLFLARDGLWKVDPETHQASRVGATPLGSLFELTGTGDGQLFGYNSSNGIVGRVDKSTGATLETHRTSAIGSPWAFAQWGGDFWLFNRYGDWGNSSVTRHSPTATTSTIVLDDSGLEIVGAGVSTCAPFKPVQ